MGRRCRVAVPASSANLGPGYDVLAAALSLNLELEVEETGKFSVDVGEADMPTDEGNLCVAAFKQLHPVEGISFRIRTEIPIAAGLGSSGAAIVSGLVAADQLYELAHSREKLFELAAKIEGHPDNVGASLLGGIVICSTSGGTGRIDRIDIPTGLEAVVVIPEEKLSTEKARAAIPDEVPIGDAIANFASASLLVNGLTTGDWDRISRGLSDRLHQPRRRELYPRSMELLDRSDELGAIGATISGAGPAVLFWVLWEQTGSLVERLREEAGEWAAVARVHFLDEGAKVI